MLIIPGKPTPLARPRFCNGRVFNSQVEEFRLFALQVFAAMTTQHVSRFDGPLSLRIDYAMPIPSKFTDNERERALAGLLMPAAVPDLSNLIKFTEDALNGLLWQDDKQIIHLDCLKYYSDYPQTIISFGEIRTPLTKENSR